MTSIGSSRTNTHANSDIDMPPRTVKHRNSEINKRHYDRKAHATKILPGDLVLVRNVTLRGKQKIADRWENEPYQVLDQPNPDVPVFDFRIADKRSRRIRRLHRNLLLPLGVTSPVATTETRYVIPQRRRQTHDVASAFRDSSATLITALT